MDLQDDTPRLAPPPKPTLLQLTMPRPEVPEISLMFDSDDSLIWPNGKFQKPKNVKGSPSVQQQHENSFQRGRLSSERIRPVVPVVDLPGKENDSRTSMQQVPQVLHKTPVQRFISGNNLANNYYKKPMSHQPQILSSQASSEKNNSPDSEKQYNPLLYSPSQRRKDSAYPAVRTNSLKHVSSQAERDANIMQQGQLSSTKSAPGDIKTDRELEVNNIISNVMKENQSSSVVKKVVQFDMNSASPSEKLTVRPKTMINDQEKLTTTTPPNQRNNFLKEGPPFSNDRMYYDSKRTNDGLASGGRFMNTPYSEAPLPSNVYSGTPLAGYNQGSHNLYSTRDGLPVQQPSAYPSALPPYTSSYGGQSTSVDNIQRPTDPKVYQLIEDQNQHILNLYKTLESFLQKREPLEKETEKCDLQFKDTPPCNCRCKHVATQTVPSEERQTQSVGTNTDLSWQEILLLAKDDHENFENDVNDRLPVTHRFSKHGEVQRLFQKNDSKHIFRRKNTRSLEQKHSSEVKEISFSMREIVMTVQEDQPSPEPSLHIDMEEYVEDSEHEVSAAAAAGPSQPDDYGNRRESPELRNSRSREDYNHNQQENGPLAVSEENRPSATFYNNVMTNIQHILQSSKTAEEEEEEEKQSSHKVRQQQATPHADEEFLDPHVEAVRQQLLQFGISFIDPSSHASNQRAMLDTVYLPGVHNMLSMYQSNIMAPYQNVYRECDATAAKYLTDTQLAAIASMSPGMRERNRKVAQVQEVYSSKGFHPDDQCRDRNDLRQDEGYSTYDNNLSMATKKFLGKYGLRNNK